MAESWPKAGWLVMVAGRERPPFEPGNELSVTHGATSPRRIAAKAAEVHAQLEAVAPWLAEPHFAPALQRYLDAAARERLLHDQIEAVAAEHGAGRVPPRVWEQATAAARLAARLGQDLGLDPIGQARLKAVAASAEISLTALAELGAEGRRVRLAAEARLADAIDAGDQGDDEQEST